MAGPKAKKDVGKDAGPQTYEVLSPLRVDDVEYEAGEPVEMLPDDAQELLDAQVLRPTKAAKAAE